MQKTLSHAFDLSEELILITGGGTGLGFGMAQCVIKAGARVIIVGRRENILRNAVDQLGKNAAYRVHDVTNIDEGKLLIASVHAEYGRITTLINNAGQIIKKPVEETTNEEFQDILTTHVTASFVLSKALIPSMKAAKQGHILFTASMAALFGLPHVIAYAAAKSAFLGMVRSMATELSADGIRVNAIAPGWIESELLLKTVEIDPERKQKVLSRTPMGRFGHIEDVGWAAVYLCSPAANFLTGVCLPVDGGISIGF